MAARGEGLPPGIARRHARNCPAHRTDDMDVCECRPTYQAQAGPRSQRKTKTHRTLAAARSWKRDTDAAFERGEVAGDSLRLADARQQFIAAAREGRALNKWGKRYKRTAIDNLDISIRNYVEPVLGHKRIGDITRGDLQVLVVDAMTGHYSGSRVRSVVNSLRALYRWAEDRQLVTGDPARHVRLPAMDAEPIERVAGPAEFAGLLDALPLADAVPYALAGYGFARAAQIIRVRWREVDLDVGAVEWGVELDARKYDASRRVVPAVPQLHAMLRRRFLEAGRPDGGELVCPPRHHGSTGLMSTSGLAKRARRRWQTAGLEPITLQECRHSGASWLDAAGVSPKIASVLMGHSTPARQPGAAPITLARYTHALPEDVERAREQLAAYLTVRQQTIASGR